MVLKRGALKRLLGMAAVVALAPLASVQLPGHAAPRQTGPVPEQATSAASPELGRGASQGFAAAGLLQLRVRRLSNAVELVIEGTGAGPQLVQSSSPSGWQGQLTTATPNGLRLGPQRVSLPEAGLQLVSLSGSGSRYQIDVTPSPGLPLGRPLVSADGQSLILTFAAVPEASLQTARANLNQPGAVPQPSYAPPLQPRAVAPPLGDMAVGTMVLRNPSYLEISGPSVTMTLRNAPARDVLMALAQIGGYGFVFVDDTAAPSAGSPTAGSPATGSPTTGSSAMASDFGGRPVSIAFRAENYARALNATLMAAGLQGKREGRTIFAGSNVLSKTFGPQLSKIYRLNQSSASSAADYLANLGAMINKTFVTTAVTSQTQSSGTPANNQANQTSQTSTTTRIESYGATAGPLRGLIGTTDSRLGTITLIGDARLVAIAESYLKQLDIRQRQVALTVRILDVTLLNDSEIKNSFAFRYGNSFIVNDQGRLLGAFGSSLPPAASAFTAAGATPTPNPGLNYPNNQLLDFINATITSSSTKVLASPTLILNENQEAITGGAAVAAAQSTQATGGNASLNTASIGRPYANESFVTVGTQVITDYTVQAGQNGAPNTCQPEFGTAGLTFGARVSKIDDNGFVTFSLSPAVSAVTGAPQPVQGCGSINVLSVRRLDTGSVRVRDGQTLILTGVISDSDVQTVSKWPILGDLPLIGQFFRSSGGNRSKNELVILVTPRIVNDDQGGAYGYGYQPGSLPSREFMGQPAN